MKPPRAPGKFTLGNGAKCGWCDRKATGTARVGFTSESSTLGLSCGFENHGRDYVPFRPIEPGEFSSLPWDLPSPPEPEFDFKPHMAAVQTALMAAATYHAGRTKGEEDVLATADTFVGWLVVQWDRAATGYLGDSADAAGPTAPEDADGVHPAEVVPVCGSVATRNHLSRTALGPFEDFKCTAVGLHERHACEVDGVVYSWLTGQGAFIERKTD